MNYLIGLSFFFCVNGFAETLILKSVECLVIGAMSSDLKINTRTGVPVNSVCIKIDEDINCSFMNKEGKIDEEEKFTYINIQENKAFWSNKSGSKLMSLNYSNHTFSFSSTMMNNHNMLENKNCIGIIFKSN